MLWYWISLGLAVVAFLAYLRVWRKGAFMEARFPVMGRSLIGLNGQLFVMTVVFGVIGLIERHFPTESARYYGTAAVSFVVLYLLAAFTIAPLYVKHILTLNTKARARNF